MPSSETRCPLNHCRLERAAGGATATATATATKTEPTRKGQVKQTAGPANWHVVHQEQIWTVRPAGCMHDAYMSALARFPTASVDPIT